MTERNHSENCTASSRRTRGKMEQLKQETSIRREGAQSGCVLHGNWGHKQV
jgi:hypothetical protein